MNNYRLKEFNPKYRAIEASKQIKEGQLIMRCQPIAHAVLSTMRTKICSHCLKEQEEQLRCSQCKVMFYCDKQCQIKDWSFHKQECKSYEAITNKKFKITAQFVLLSRCYLISQKDKKTEEELSKFLELSELQPQDLRQYYMQMAAVFLQNFAIQKSEQNMSKLIRLSAIISINTFTIQDYLFNHAGIAIGMYSPANFINHSCNPNSVQVFNGKELNIIALRDIENEEEITISYIDQTLDIKERKNILRQSYYFECLCYQCLAQKAVQRDLADLLCDKCDDGCLVKKEEGESICNKCKEVFSPQKVNIKKQQIQKLKTILEKQVSYEQSIKSFYSLRKLLKFSNPFFAKVIQNLYYQALQLAQAKQSQKYYSDAYQLMKAYLFNFPKWYHMTNDQKFHILLLWKYAEMSKLAMHLGKIKKAMEYTEKAIAIHEKSRLSVEFEEVKNLKKRYEELKIECRMNATNCRK